MQELPEASRRVLQEQLGSLTDYRAQMVEQREHLREQIRDLDALIAAYDRVLKAGGLSPNGTKKKEKGKVTPPGEEATRKMLDFVNSRPETDSTTAAEALGVSQSYAGKTLAYMREQEQIRLLRTDTATPDGRGRKPVYGPWPT